MSNRKILSATKHDQRGSDDTFENTIKMKSTSNKAKNTENSKKHACVSETSPEG